MSPVKQNTGEFEVPNDPGLQVVLYRLGKIEESQTDGKERDTEAKRDREARDAVVMARLDEIMGSLHEANISLATGTERMASQGREIGDLKERVTGVETVQRTFKTVTHTPNHGQTNLYRRAGIDAKFWVTISTAIAALGTAIAAAVPSLLAKSADSKDKGVEVSEPHPSRK